MAAFYIFYVLSLALMVSYTVYAVRTVGIPTSLSETYYLLKDQGRKGWPFMAALCLGGLFVLAPFIEFSPEDVAFLPFFAGAGLMFVGLAPQFGMKVEKWVHYIGAAVTALSVVLWSIFAYEWLWITVIATALAVIYPIVKKPSTWLFWAEMAVFAAGYINLFVAFFLK